MERIIHDENGVAQFRIETVEQPSPLRGTGDRVVARAADNIKDVGEVVAQACSDIFTTLNDKLQGIVPDAVELEFGVSLSAEAGLPFVTKATGESTFKVKVKWSPNS